MKIYIITDLEGASGVFKFAQTRGVMGTQEGIAAVRLLMGDIAAVVKGLRDGGASEVYVLDGHGSGNNFLPEEMLADGARYITGKPRPPLAGLDESFAGLVQLGMHAMNGTPDGILHHTQSSGNESKYWYDGIERGEIYQGAVHAGHYNIPVIMVTGDEAACREAKELLGEDLPTAAVKKGLSREAAILLPLPEARELLYQTAKTAMKEIAKRKVYKPNFPIKLRKIGSGTLEDSSDTPWYTEVNRIVHNGRDITAGSVDA